MSEYTIVAFYGEKEPSFSGFIQKVRDHIKHSPIGDYFVPYQMDQIHATIVGLESINLDGDRYNLNIWEEMRERRQIKLEGSLEEFKNHTDNLSVRFGGFNSSFDERLSWNQSLYLRSFGIHTNTLKVVLNGWPVIEVGDQFRLTDAIWLLRSSLYESHNMRHRYHALKDNDMFMVVGDLKNPFLKDESKNMWFHKQIASVNEEVQQMLSKLKPHYETLTLDKIKLVEYENDSLETFTSRAWPVKILEERSREVKRWLGLE